MMAALAALGGLIVLLLIGRSLYGRGRRAGRDAVVAESNTAAAAALERMAEAAAEASPQIADPIEKSGKGHSDAGACEKARVSRPVISAAGLERMCERLDREAYLSRRHSLSSGIPGKRCR
jgi:hypothetical protein